MITERPIIVKIRNNTTGEIVDHPDVGNFDEDGFIDFIWSDGNYSCDCNRYLFFHRAKSFDNPCGNETYSIRPCGYETYSIQITCDGVTVYDEFEP